VAKLFVNPPTPTFSPSSYVRNALEQGLVQEQLLGVNPFKLGFVGGTDGHDGTAGATEEYNYKGHLSSYDATAAQRLASINPVFGIKDNPGGLTVLWAEENSRDALFEAMQRRESYATSGTRPIVRFFGGFKYPGNMCNQANFVKKGYDFVTKEPSMLLPLDAVRNQLAYGVRAERREQRVKQALRHLRDEYEIRVEGQPQLVESRRPERGIL
jgi:hypothetical protein